MRRSCQHYCRHLKRRWRDDFGFWILDFGFPFFIPWVSPMAINVVPFQGLVAPLRGFFSHPWVSPMANLITLRGFHPRLTTLHAFSVLLRHFVAFSFTLRSCPMPHAPCPMPFTRVSHYTSRCSKDQACA